MNKIIISLLLTISISLPVYSQQSKDKSKFIEPKNETWETIEKEIKEFNAKPDKKPKKLIPDFDKIEIPKSLSDFKQSWHNEPIMQSATGTCWCFCGTSFLESEIERINHKKLKMSEMHTVYYEYIERALDFIKTHGATYIGEGSQSSAVVRIWKKYGCVPEDTYTGKLNGQKHHDHTKMFAEIDSYLKFCKANNIWSEEMIIPNIKAILNHFMGVPPTEFSYNNKNYTPKQFLNEVVSINLDDYIDFMSLKKYDFNTWNVYEVPDNWWFGKFFNINADNFINSIKKAIKNGFTMTIGGDVSEAGLYSYADAAIVPSFDIPSEYIDDDAREFRFENGTTGDDHGIQIVGYTELKNKTWFLIKDSGSGARNGKMKGYYMYSEDYVKLKMLTFMAHKDAVPDLIKLIK
ncbi:MAG TPA: C1 family peptidase [Candidatus Kapabacteria bacterium]|nr:C1 family peptidase [Candidatus Kapabacteria bacterium]